MASFETLNGKNVVITGGGRGIGLTIAQACKSAGAAVTIVARSPDDLANADRLLKSIRPEIGSLAIRGDVTRDEDLMSAYQESAKAHGPIFGLICAAGVYGVMGAFANSHFEDWAKTIEINLTGTARAIHRALPFMSGKDGGRIILFSGGGQGAMANFSDYVSSKGAIWRLTETLGAELASREIFVNSVAPGAVNTKLLNDLLDAGPERVGQEVYDKSLQQRDSGGQNPQKAAELCLYLLSSKSHGLYGKTLSAIWDDYKEFKDLNEMSRTDLFTYRRVVDQKGNTRG
jgi:NAD(P)-dependent dehydrogenase (short-subunit alcohol dehydrogenase family)